jgi:AcrR family transcriptional regulator
MTVQAAEGRTVTASPREQLPTLRGRQTQAAIDAAARTVIARKGFLAATISDIAAEAGRSTASFYNYYDSKESMVREWVQRFLADATDSARTAGKTDLTNRERAHQAAATYWYTYRNKLPEIISVSQLAMVSDDFAGYWNELCALPIALIAAMVKRAQNDGYSTNDDPELTALALVSMLNQFCYYQLSGDGKADAVDDDACIDTLANVVYRTIYHKETGPT